MVVYKNTLRKSILLGIFIINIMSLTVQIQEEGFWNSNDVIVQFLKGFGFTGMQNKTSHALPRLTGMSQTNPASSSLTPPGIRAATQSEYFVPGWADSRWKYRKNITIDYSKVSADLTNFPVLINVFDSDLQSDAQANGNDIMFTDTSGYILDHEVELYKRIYNSTHAHLVAWVKANLSSTQDTIISMYFSNPTASNQENANVVWGDNYVGVWHLTESGGGTVNEFKDSSQYNNHGQGGEGNSSFVPTKVGGKIGYGQDFNNLDGNFDLIDCGNDSSLNITGYSITLEAWIQHNITPQNHYYGIMNHKGWIDGYSLWIEQLSLKLAFNLPGSSHKLLGTSDVTTNTWHHIVATYDGANLRVYIDGTLDGTLPKTDAIKGTSQEQDFWIGHGDQPKDKLWSAEWDGQIDEVRISNIARTSDWIEAEFNNQYNPDSFYSVGTTECSPDFWAFNTFKYRKQITINAAKVSSDLVNFPVLIDLYDMDLNDSAKVQADGDDIVFTTVSGVKLDHEIELFEQTFNTTHAHLVAWVRVPNLSATDDTDLIMYYGNKAAVSQENPTGVWNNKYQAVYHLNDDPTGTVNDSTLNNNDGTTSGSMTSSDQVQGIFDGSIDFDGSDDLINIGDVNSDLWSGITVQSWIFHDVTGDDRIICKSPGTATQDHIFSLAVVTSGSDDVLRVRLATDGVGGSLASQSSDSHSFTTGTWHHIAFTWDSTSETIYLYIDGSQDIYSYSKDGDSIKDSAVTVILANVNIGTLNRFYDGKIDEARISNVARSSDWITTEFNNQDDPDTFFSVSSEEENSNHWVDGSFRYRKTIVIDKDKVSGDLSNFPVLIDLNDSDIKSGRIQSDADDIIFIDQTGEKLDHEIELFQQSSSYGRLIAWVRVPSLSSISDTNITMYYGNSAANDQENPSGVWGTDYNGVWHLSELGTGTRYDSTNNKNNGIPTDYDNDEAINGVIAGADDFDGVDDHVVISDPGIGSIYDFDTGTNITISAWIRPESFPEQWNTFLTKGSTPSAFANFGCQVVDDNLDGIDGKLDFFYRDSINTNWNEYQTSADVISTGNWFHVVFAYTFGTGSSLKIFVNGAEIIGSWTSRDGNDDPLVSNAELWFGADDNAPYGSPNELFDGIIDEIRLSNSFHSADWITTEYNNQYDPTSFYSVTSEEVHPYWWADASFGKRKDIAIDKEKVSGDLSNFPVLLDIYDSDLRTDVQTDAADLMFTDSFNTKLDHEIELFDQTGNGTHAHLIAWVSIPTLFNNTDTLLSMYYGNNELESQENSEGVWREYGGVWHLSEDPTSVAPQFKDSTLNDNDGTAMNLASENQVTGKIDGSLTFDDSNERCVEIPHYSSLQFSSQMTISAWVKTTDSDNDVGLIINKWGAASANRNYWLGKLDDSNIAFFVDDTQNVQASLSYISDNNWHYVVGVADSSNSLLRIYIDGIQRNTASYDGSSVMGTEELAIGHGSGEIEQEWNGGIDECRVQSVVHSTSWIVTEYNNQFNSTSFYTVGSEVIFDETPPEILNFGVDDPGTGIGKFWAEITDDSEIASVEVTINDTNYSMNYWNETHWYYDYSVESFQGYYEYLITNASDTMGNYLETNSSLKYYTFDNDLVGPSVLDWEYYDTLGPYGTFQANVTDSWGVIDTVRVNVTTYNIQALMGQYTTFGSTIFAYMNDTLEMTNGLMDFQIIVNDTAGNEFVSSTHPGDVFSNHPPIAENLTLSPAIPWSNCSLTFTYDYYDEDGHDEAGTEIRWYKKNDSVFLLEPTYNDTNVIPASALEVNDQWYVNVTPKDGELFGETNMSVIITILNTPPSVSAVVVFYSGSDPYTTSTLSIDYTYDDHEVDIEDTNNREVEWFRNSVHNSTLDNSTSISPGNTTKGDTWYYRIRVYDGTTYSSWVTSDTVLIQNSIPQAVNLALPSNPTTMDDLVAEWDMADADVDTEDQGAVIIYWYKDGENQSAWTNLTTIGAGNTSKGESWRFEIRVYDGENYSALTPLNPPVVILNSAPTVSNVELTPTTPVTTDGLNATWNYSDDDTDPEGTPLIKWYLDNEYQPAYDGETILPDSATAKGDNWHFGIQVFDGTTYAAEVNSSQVVIQNTPPEVDNLALTAAPKTTTDLVASWDSADNDTGDSLTFNVTWYLAGEVNCSWLTSANSATLTAGNTTKGDNWSFTVQAYDGEVYSSIASLGYNRTILNTIPVVANLIITSNPTTTDTLLAEFDYSDADLADNTSLIFNITWYRNGLEQSDFANTTSISSGNTNKTQFWWFTVQAYDGENFSLKLESAHVQILNTAPDINNLVISPPSPPTATDLVASWNETDADNDILTYTIRWYIVGVGLQSAYNDLKTVPASATVKGQTWYYNLTAFDGDASSPEKSSSQVVIQNSSPEVDSLEVTTNPTTTDDLIASWTATDNDTGDSLTFNVSWYLNGEVNCSWLTSVNSATLDAGNTTKDHTWNVTVQAYDGDAYSNILSLVTNISILNSKPIVENPSFNNTSPDVDDDFHITYTFVDVDIGDIENLTKIIVYWYINWNYNASFQNQTTIYGANTTATEVWYYIIKVFDGETYSDNVTSEQGVYIGGGSTNTPPMAIDLTLVPATPQTHEALIANYNFSDVDADPQVAYEIRWYMNSGTGFQLQSEYNSLFIVPASATSKDQQWNFTIKVFDGIQWSELNISTTITITNTNPEVSNAGISSSPKTTDDLIASWASSDNDSDSLTFILTWYVNGIENATFANKTIIEAGNTTKGEEWYFTVQAYDGEGLSNILSLGANLTILNTAPLASNLTITASPYTFDDLVAAWDYFDIDNDPRDDALAQIYWFKNGLNQTALANQKTVGSTNTSKNQVWWFIVQVFDGENYSIANYESVHIQILNSIPVVENLEISISNPKTTDELSAQWDDYDNDSDILSRTIKWYKNTIYQPDWDNEDTIPASATSKGEIWYYTLKAFDGSDYSSEETLSPGVLILNTVPVIEDLALTMYPQTTDNLVTSWTSSDNDSDSLTFLVTWYLNGIENTTFANKTMIEAGNTTKGEEWYFTVQAYDGEGLSSIISLAANVTILNTAPIASNLIITANPTTFDDLIADWDYFDIDNDPRDDALARINWFKNGENQTALANQKIVGSTNTSKNQVWWFSVQVFDSENYSILTYQSAHISIQNAVPYSSSALPLPINPTKANGLVLTLSAIIDVLYDPDPSDDIEVVRIRWYKEGILQGDLNNSLTVPGTRLTKGEVWNYSIVPFDGVAYGLVCVSAEIVILNSKPTIINTYFTVPTFTTISDLVISFQAEDADGDNITISGVQWYRYDAGIPGWVYNDTYDDYMSLPATATTKGESWKFRLEVSDGTESSLWKEAAKEADIINSEPRIDPFSISLTGGSTTSDPLQVNYAWYDDDPEDSNTQTIITWENSGDYLEDTYSTTLSADETTAGERWWVTITPYDGEDYGDYVNSKRYGISIIIGNTPPSLVPENIEINGEFNGTEYQGTSFGTVFNLNLHYTASDLDGDQGVPAYDLHLVDGFASGSEYRWYRNRSGIVTLYSVLNDEITVLFYYTQKGDTWWVQVRPRDFYGDFGIPQNSSQITIGNTAPQILELRWLRLTYYTTNNLVFGYTFFDYDTEDIQQGTFIRWYRNGTYLPGFDNNTAIASQFTKKGEVWYVNLSIFDGESYSSWCSLLSITIQNSPPTVTSILLTPVSPNTTQPLLATWTFDDADNDSENQLAALIQWFRNGNLVDSLTNNSNNPPALTNREESWYFTVQVTDGYNYSIIIYQSEIITIINSAPTAFGLQINDGSTEINTTADLILTWNFNDPDILDIEDRSSALILWYLNGVEQSAFRNATEILHTSVVKGQEWMVSIKVCDNGGLWSEFVNSSLVVIQNSVPTITIDVAAHPEFIIEDETLEINLTFYSYTDEDGDEDQPVISWYCNDELIYQNIWVILANDTVPGDVWYYTIQPFDGTDYGGEYISPEISIESRPMIHSFIVTALPDTEGHYELEINVTDSHNEIKQVKFLLSLNTTNELSSFIITSPKSSGSTLWLLDYTLTTYSYLDTPTLVTVTVVTEVTYSTINEIYLIQTFNFNLEDKAPPRVLNAYFEMNDDLNPTNLTFYAEVQDFGSGVAEVILFYYFRPSDESNQTGGNGAALLQDDLDWLDVPMMVQVTNETGQFILYMVTVDFVHENSDLDIIYRLSTEDVAGNANPAAFDIRDYPQRVKDQRFIYQSPGLPEWVLLVAGLAVFVIFVGSIVYVKFIRKPELVGLDKDLVIAKISEITDAEMLASLDLHTIGVVVSFFDQRHGPIPIIIIPEILKDNFNKLVDLSDRSFSGTGFSDDFDVEIPSSYDFVLSQGVRTSVMSFGFALERPDSRGGQENLTCNIIIHQDLFPLVQSFQNEIKRIVHAIHVRMDKESSEKDKIRKDVFELRKYISLIVLSYANIYGTTELMEE